MAYAAGSVTSEYRLSMAKLEGDITAIERRLKAIQPPQLASLSVETGGQRQVAELARLNAQVAAQQSRALADQQRLATQAAVGQQRLAQAQNATAVSAQRVTQAQQQTAQALSRTARESANAAAAQARAEAAQLRLASAQQRAAVQQERLAAGGQRWTSSLSSAAGRVDQLVGTVMGLGGAFAAVSAAQAGLDFARTGASIAAARQSFDNLATSAGTSGEVLLRSLQETSAGTVATTDIIKSSNTALLLLGSDVATKLPQLLAIAKASATTLGTDVGQVFDSLVTGISRGSTELIDNAGIVVKAGEAQAAYAASIGKSVDALTASEKQQALLNAVLQSGQGILAQTAGGGEAANAAYQRFDASVANLTATLQTGIASGLAPTVDWLARVAQEASDGISALGDLATQNQDLGVRILAGASSYEEYSQRVAQAQQLAQQALDEAYAKDPIGKLVAQATGAVPVIQALSREQVELALQMQATGTSADAAFAAVSAATPAVQLLGQAVDYAALRTPDAVAGIQALEPALIAAATASETARAQVEATLQAYLDGALTAGELAVALQNIQLSSEAAAAGQQLAAAASAEAQAALMGYSDAALVARDASGEAEAAAYADALAKFEQATAAEITAQQHANLEQAIIAAAQSSGSAEAGAARVAGAFRGTEIPAIVEAINRYRELIAVKAAAGQGAVAIPPGQIGGARAAAAEVREAGRQLQVDLINATGTTAQRLALVNTQLAAGNLPLKERNALIVRQAQLQQQLSREQERANRPADGGGGGGGGRSPAVRAAEQEGQDLARLDERRGELSRDTQRRLEEQAADHAARLAKIVRESGERQLQIQRQYAERQLAAERQLRVGSLNSRADFYDALTQSTPKIGQGAAEGLAAAYEAAFAQAQQFAQSGQAQLASSYLQLRQRQIQEELSYQQAVARARAEGDAAEVARLQRIEALRAAARAEELKQLVEGGDQNVKARDDALGEEADRTAEALAAEGERYAEQTGKIADASAEKARKLAIDEARIRGEVAQTNTVLAEQLRLAQQLGGLPATGAGLPQAQAQAATPPPAPVAPAAPGAALAPGQAGGPVVVTDPQIAAQVATLDATVARLAGAVEAQQGILDRIASNTGDTARRVGSGRSGA
ncbi:MAG TPA: hypothetical protein PKD53_04730 [Chloroflexaceae bacterium]|nr:hypothetical protein [Chloroflexaceae bacterium]